MVEGADEPITGQYSMAYDSCHRSKSWAERLAHVQLERRIVPDQGIRTNDVRETGIRRLDFRVRQRDQWRRVRTLHRLVQPEFGSVDDSKNDRTYFWMTRVRISLLDVVRRDVVPRRLGFDRPAYPPVDL